MPEAVASTVGFLGKPEYISPILSSITLYITTKLESRELVDDLISLSFADDYGGM